MDSSFLAQVGALAGVGITSIVLVLVALLLGGIGWFQARGVRAAQTWSATEGEVMEATVEKYVHSTRDGTMIAYRPHITYGYRVGGREYVGERLNFGSGVHSSIRGFAENKVKQFPTGGKVQVYYDPQNPNEATLERSSPSTRLFYIIAGILLVLAVVLCAAGIGFSSFFAGF